MRLGAHMSISGGVFNAFQRGAEVGCETMLIFTKSNRQWTAKPLTDEDIQQYRQEQAKYPHIHPVAVHASYLINIASTKPDIWQKSYDSLKLEVERADLLGIPYLTFHPGSHMGVGEEVGLQKIAESLIQLVAETATCQTIVCLETMAGQGTNLGYTFEQLATILEKVSSSRVGVCMDTCHVLAAGYDIRTPEAYEATMQRFDKVVGLDQIKCFHFNDSQYELGSKRDRHEHIGEGYVGQQGFANFVNDPRWANYVAQIETPKTKTDNAGKEIEMDTVNLNTLKSLRQ